MAPASVMTSRSHSRTDAEWICELGMAGTSREAALADLRVVLVAGLHRAFGATGLAEDSAQETLVRVLERLQAFRADSRFTTWALSIATRITLSEIRRARWRDVSLDQMSEAGRLNVSIDQTASTESQYEQTALLMVVRRALETDLTDRQRRAIQAELGGAPPEEIAARLGTTRNALYKLVYDGRVRLRAAILRSGWTEDHVRQVIRGL
jgi:RNA polymerase sigma-70 factor (ECF subfamily)